MEMLQKILIWTALPSAVVLASAGVAVLCSQRGLFPGRWLLCAFRRLPWPIQMFLLAFVMRMVVHGSMKTNQQCAVQQGEIPVVQQRGRDIPVACDKEASTLFSRGRNAASPLGANEVDDSDVARGYRMVEVSTNADYSYAMPTNAVLCGHWHQRGAYDDVTLVDFGNWSFLHGSNEVSRLWAFTWGMARAEIRDVAHEIAPVGSPMSAIPNVSRLWTAATTNDTRLVTWENFAVGRILRDELEQLLTDENRFLSAQVELFANGDFITRSNSVETAYRRVCPEDWDDDGIPNSRDPRPYFRDGDFFGPRQALPDGANANAYCWVELVAPVNAHVVFTGDGESDLPDPDFIARAGETNRVTLLIGKTYSVESDWPLTVTDRSDEDIRIYGDGSCSLTAVWPVSVSVTEGNGTNFRMRVDPDRIGGEFAWDTCCCPVTGWGRDFSWECGGLCLCSGCTAYGMLVYEGYAIPVEGGSCGCSYGPRQIRTEPDDGQLVAGVSASFSPEAVIFEDAYTNMPGWVENWRSTEAVLSCTVHGGFRGGTASFSFAGETNLVWIRGASVPHQPVTIPPGEKLSFAAVYKGLRPSDEEDDVVYTVTFAENDTTNAPTVVEAKLTSVKLQLTAVYDAPENHNSSRHIYGVGELVSFNVQPNSPNVIFRTIRHDTADDSGYGYELFGSRESCPAPYASEYRCPISASYQPLIRVCCGDCEYSPTLAIVEPQEVITTGAAWGENAVDPQFYIGDLKCWPEGMVGSACLVTTNYIGPLYVSFQGVAFTEVPCDEEDIITGCFTNGHRRTHIPEAGAGKIHFLDEKNFFFRDGARSGSAEENWIPNSTMVWKIPIGWHRIRSDYYEGKQIFVADTEHNYDESSRKLLIGGRLDLYNQRRNIDSDGTYRTDKFGHWISRSRSCLVILDGKTLQERHGTR